MDKPPCRNSVYCSRFKRFDKLTNDEIKSPTTPQMISDVAHIAYFEHTDNKSWDIVYSDQCPYGIQCTHLKRVVKGNETNNDRFHCSKKKHWSLPKLDELKLDMAPETNPRAVTECRFGVKCSFYKQFIKGRITIKIAMHLSQCTHTAVILCKYDGNCKDKTKSHLARFIHK